MLIVVDPHSGVPIYRQILEQVRYQVAAGLAAAGEELPSTRALSQQLGVNPMTVSKAYSQLEAEGVVTRRPGLPLVVSESAARSAGGPRQHLRALLEPAVTGVLQLGLDVDDAVELFRDMVEQAAREERV